MAVTIHVQTDGDAVGAAMARLALAQRNLAEKTARYQAGLTTNAEVEAAKTDAAILEIKLREAETRAGKPAGSAPSHEHPTRQRTVLAARFTQKPA